MKLWESMQGVPLKEPDFRKIFSYWASLSKLITYSVLEELTTKSLEPWKQNFVLFTFYSQYLAQYLMNSKHPVFVSERLNQVMG